MNIDPCIPEAVRPSIKNYVLLTEKRLVGLINAFYIVGSIALGEFNEHFSDIDFLTILNRKATAVEIERLHKIHQTIEKTYPRWKMSGSYIQLADLGKLGNDVQPHPHFHDGVLSPAALDGLNSVTWWELKNHGIVIVGTEPRNLPFMVDWDLLIGEMRENLNSYWLSWTQYPRRMILLYSNWGIQWSVLGVLRQFYTFRENSITTKVRAAEYALDYRHRSGIRLFKKQLTLGKAKGIPLIALNSVEW
jgi:hypothetical protein